MDFKVVYMYLSIYEYVIKRLCQPLTILLNDLYLNLLTRNNIIKYWELSIGTCQSSSANDKCDESDGI